MSDTRREIAERHGIEICRGYGISYLEPGMRKPEDPPSLPGSVDYELQKAMSEYAAALLEEVAQKFVSMEISADAPLETVLRNAGVWLRARAAQERER